MSAFWWIYLTCAVGAILLLAWAYGAAEQRDHGQAMPVLGFGVIALGIVLVVVFAMVALLKWIL